MTYKITTLKLGEMTLDKGILTRGKDVGTKVTVPLWALAIEGNGIKAIVDTGFRSVEWTKANGPADIMYAQSECEKIVSVLKEIGWTPDDINVVINTHLHLESCGNNNLFKNAKYYIQANEWEFALNPLPHHKQYYSSELFTTKSVDTTRIVFVDGEYTLIDGIVLLSTPGHTRGNQSVLVETEEGIVIFTGGAANLMENIYENILPNVLDNSPQAYKSLEDFRRKGAYAIPCHEPRISNFASNGFPLIHPEN